MSSPSSPATPRIDPSLDGVGWLDRRRPARTTTTPAAVRAPLPLATSTVLVLTDAVVLLVVAAAASFGYAALAGVSPDGYVVRWPALGLLLAGFAAAGLYSPGPLTPVEEIRRLVSVVTLGCLGLGAVMFLFESFAADVRTVLVLTWAGLAVACPAARTLLRYVCAPRWWWGRPVLLIGAGKQGLAALKSMKRQPDLGLKPLAVLDDRARPGRVLGGVPVAGGVREADRFPRRRHVIALIAYADLPADSRDTLLRDLADRFHRVLLLPQTERLASLGVTAVDLGGRLGLEVRHRLLDPEKRLIKRLLDATLTAALAPLLAPVIAAIAVAVKLDSPGPVFYRQTRIGEGGREFRIVKFRSMVVDSDAALRDHLGRCDQSRAEWGRSRKLRDDPRVTRVGRVLRRTSLDELPQLWNVLLGEMSLVGPRPIVEDEVRLYGDDFDLFCRVRPGVTGLWQTSGRNAVRYAERVALDGYYVRNWSIWLDLYLLAKTFLAVVLRRGAF